MFTIKINLRRWRPLTLWFNVMNIIMRLIYKFPKLWCMYVHIWINIMLSPQTSRSLDDTEKLKSKYIEAKRIYVEKVILWSRPGLLLLYSLP